MTKLALYKGPAEGFLNKLAHYAICLFTWSRYSHCELVIGGMCYSASFRDGGVRKKAIDLDSGKWDVVTVSGDSAYALRYFEAHEGQPYDWVGAGLSSLGLSRRDNGKQFCSGVVAGMLNLSVPEAYTPAELGRKYK